jgi:hypothetical protein
VRVQAAPVGEIVIVLLFAEAERREGDGIIGRDVGIMDVSASGGDEAEVLCDDWQCIGPVAPVGVVDGGKFV